MGTKKSPSYKETEARKAEMAAQNSGPLGRKKTLNLAQLMTKGA
jgi:hypothetical protein